MGIIPIECVATNLLRDLATKHVQQGPTHIKVILLMLLNTKRFNGFPLYVKHYTAVYNVQHDLVQLVYWCR